MKSVDGVFYDWGERWDWATQRAKKIVPRQASIRILPDVASSNESTQIKARLNSITKKTPQAIVKISGGGKGMRTIAAHIRYIARHGEVDILDERGNRYSGGQQLGDVIDSIELGGGAVVPAESEKKEAFNIVLSSPTGSDRESVRRASEAFAREMFKGSQWVIAHHDDTPNPHAHLMVKAVGLNGRRLNPRKAELQVWRAKWAMHLRDNGVLVDATPRAARLQRSKGVTQRQHHMRARGIDGEVKPNHLAREKARRTQRAAVRDLWAVHAALKRTGRKSDLAEARRLAKFLKEKGAYDYRDERHAAVAVEVATRPTPTRGSGVRTLSEFNVARPGRWTRDGLLPGHARDHLHR